MNQDKMAKKVRRLNYLAFLILFLSICFLALDIYRQKFTFYFPTYLIFSLVIYRSSDLYRRKIQLGLPKFSWDELLTFSGPGTIEKVFGVTLMLMGLIGIMRLAWLIDSLDSDSGLEMLISFLGCFLAQQGESKRLKMLEEIAK